MFRDTFYRSWQWVCLFFIVIQALPPPLVLSPARLASFERHTSTRQKAQYKVSVANILSHGKLKKRADFFAASEENVVSMLITLLENRDEEEDLEMLMNVTSGHRGARQYNISFDYSEPNISQESTERNSGIDHHHHHHQHALYTHVQKACSEFRAEHLNESVFHTFVEPDHPMSPTTSLESEQTQYSLKRCLSARGIAVHKVLLPDEKRSIKIESPGSVAYRRKKTTPVSFIECGGRTAAYSAAWIASKELLLDVDMSPRSTLEWHSHNLFIWVFYQNRNQQKGTYGYAFKTSDYRDFFVNHLSHWDRKQNDVAVARVAAAAARECAPTKQFKGLKKSMSLVPFWGGSAGASGGNAHSITKRAAKVDQLAGVVCSSLKYFERAVVGVCSDEDRVSVLEKLNTNLQSAVGIKVPPYSFEDSLAIRQRTIMYANLRNMKVPVSGGATVLEMAELLKEYPDVLAKMPTIPNYGNASITDGSKPSEAKVIVAQFGCGRGVHLPYHLLELSQHLLSNEATIVKKKHMLPVYEHGLLDHIGLSDFDYVYFTEADQITTARFEALPDIVKMLNGTNYVAPQRMQMVGAQIAESSELGNSSLSEVTLNCFHQMDTQASLQGGLGERRRLLSCLSTGSKEPFNMENECVVGAGEAGYLGKPDVHFPPRDTK